MSATRDRLRYAGPIRICSLLAILASFVLLIASSSASAAASASAAEAGIYAKDFNVPKSVAAERLAVQAKGTEADIVGELEQGLGGDFAGVWFDNESGEFVVPVADVGRADVAGRKLASLGLQATDFRTRSAQSSWSELEAVQDRLDAALAEQLKAGLVQTSLDPRTNSVVIHQSEEIGKSGGLRIKRLAESQAVDVDIREKPPNQLRPVPAACINLAFPFCDRPLRGGVGIGGASSPGTEGVVATCTSGFKATGLGTGTPYVLTAGHCVGGYTFQWASENSQGKEHYLGFAEQWQSGTQGGNEVGRDAAKINADGTYWDINPWYNWVVEWESEEEGGGVINASHPITGESSSYLGQAVCHTGITTGTSCATVTAVGKTVDFEDEAENILYDMSEFYPACVWGGDSGGPVFAGSTALGLTIYRLAEEPECQQHIGFSEITDVTDLLGVTVAPRFGAPPRAKTGNQNGFPAPHQATVTGTVDPNGVTSNYHFQFGQTTAYGSTSQLYGAGSGWQPVAVSGTLKNLKGNTTYNFRIKAENAKGNDTGVNKTFTTPDWRPQITPQAPTEIKAGHANLNAQVNPQGSQTEYHFEVGKQAGVYDYAVPYPSEAIGSGASNVAVNETIDVKGQTEYHWRVVAQNDEGITVSPDQAFTTPDWRPAVTTEKQTGVKVLEEQGQATLHGKVNPKGFATDYRFEWGTQEEFEAEEYGHSIPVPDGEAGSGEEDVSVQATIEGIKGSTTYHYRLVAENAEGKAPNPEDRSFTTPDWRPKLSSVKAVEVDRQGGTLAGWVNPKGFATSYRFEWGTEEEFEAEEYNHATPVPDEAIGSGQEDVEVSRTLEGLQRNAAYHFRLVAENAEGTSSSNDKTFVPADSAFEAGEYPATLNSALAATFILGGSFGSNDCDEGPEFNSEISEPSEALSGVGLWAQCARFGVPTTLKANGCQLELDPGFFDGESFAGEVAIGPPGCGPVTYEGAGCEIAYPAQPGLEATLENSANGELSVAMHAHDMRYTSAGGPACPAGEYHDGTLDGTWRVLGSAALSLTEEWQIVPTASTGAATSLKGGHATLHGAVNPNGHATTYSFEYGETTAYGQSAPAEPESVGSGEEAVPVSETLVGLSADVPYHYRLIAESAEGVVEGEDRTFEIHLPRYEAGGYPASVSGEQGAADKLTFKLQGHNASCEKASVSGALASASEELSLSPSYGECTAFGIGAATIDPNGCSYELHAGSHWSAAYVGALDISCPGEEAIEISAAKCSVSIGSQSGLSVLRSDASTESPPALAASLDVKGLEYTVTEAGFLCPLEEEANTNGKLTGSLTAHAESEAQAPLSLEPAGEDEEAHSPSVEAEEYVAELSGEQEATAKQTFKVQGASASCGEASVSGTLSSAAAEFSLSPSYDECSAFGFSEATIEPNGCEYTTHVGEAIAAGRYEGALDISCPGEEAIEITAFTCTVAIGSQSGLAGLELEDVEQAGKEAIALTADVSALEYTVTEAGFLCPLEAGSGENGSFTGTTELRGKDGTGALQGLRVSGS